MERKIPLSPLGERLEQARLHFQETHKQKLSWSKLSLKVGKTVSAPSNWKKGKISNDLLKDLAVVLGVNFNWLLDGSGLMLSEPSSEIFNTDEALTIGRTYIEYVQTKKKSQDLVKKLSELMSEPKFGQTTSYFKDLNDTQNLIVQNNEHLESLHRKLTTLTANIVS